MASSVAPMSILMEASFGAISLAASACSLQECPQHSFFSWRLHCGADAPIRRVPTPACGWWSSPGFPSLQFIKEDLTSYSPVCDSVGTASALGKFLHPLPKDGEIAIMEGNKFFHPVNVINDELSNDSDLKLTEWLRFTPLFQSMLDK